MGFLVTLGSLTRWNDNDNNNNSSSSRSTSGRYSSKHVSKQASPSQESFQRKEERKNKPVRCRIHWDNPWSFGRLDGYGISVQYSTRVPYRTVRVPLPLQHCPYLCSRDAFVRAAQRLTLLRAETSVLRYHYSTSFCVHPRRHGDLSEPGRGRKTSFDVIL